MKDIDFDELDRAVNSLISPDKTPAAEKPVAATPSPVPVSAPTPPAPASATPPLAERRSQGRFMDVVHPSSDMRSSPVPPRPSTQPTQSVHSEMTITPPTPASPVAEPATEPKEEPAADPINMTQPATKEPDAASSPLESPFLSDAKVEKRPLGAFSNETPAPVSSPTTSQPEETKPEMAKEADGDDKQDKSDHPMGSDTPLPAELQDNLLSIEANEDTSAKKDETPDPVPTMAFPGAATSIPTQYAEQPSTGDQPTAAVFNTDAYKKPAAHPKKKSGWLVVLWIFLLLVVGGGVGAAIYFFVLPKL